jgi:transposase-like protein
MAQPPYAEDQLREAVQAYKDTGGNKSEAARILGLHRATYRDRLIAAEQRLGIQLGPVAKGSLQGLEEEVRPLPKKGEIRRYLVSSAQNNTLVNVGVWENFQALARHFGAEILIGTFTYNKSAYGDKAVKRGTFNRSKDTDDLWYDPQLTPFIHDKRIELAPGLVWCGEMNIIPTADDPLSGFENYTGRRSGIFPHVKMEMRSIASAKYEPTKFNYTTGTLTLRNYIQKKAGLKGEFHHVYGGLIIEVDDKGAWFVRQLNADGDDGIQDLTVYAQLGKAQGGYKVEAITWGDIHLDQLDPEVDEIAWAPGGLLDELQPTYQFMHDTLAISCGISHHDLKSPTKQFGLHVTGRNDAWEEMRRTAAFLTDRSYRPWCKTIVVDSNHDRHLKRWIEETDYRHDHVNALFYLRTALAMYEAIERQSNDFHLVECVLRNAGCSEDIMFWRRDESFIICYDKSGGIECGMHGDEGANGTRGTPTGLSKLGRKMNIGDKHSAEIRHGLYVAGTSSLMDMGYNNGPSSWSHSLIVTYQNGKRAILTMWAGKYKA